VIFSIVLVIIFNIGFFVTRLTDSCLSSILVLLRSEIP